MQQNTTLIYHSERKDSPFLSLAVVGAALVPSRAPIPAWGAAVCRSDAWVWFPLCPKTHWAVVPVRVSSVGTACTNQKSRGLVRLSLTDKRLANIDRVEKTKNRIDGSKMVADLLIEKGENVFGGSSFLITVSGAASSVYCGARAICSHLGAI